MVEALPQLLANGAHAAAWICLMAVGLSVCYRPGRFLNFSHGVVFTCGAYLTFLCKSWIGIPLVLSAVAAVSCCVGLGCAMDLWAYRPLRRRGASSLVLLLASLGVYVVIQNVVSMSFGEDIRTIRSAAVREGVNILGAKVTLVQVVTLCVSIALVGALTAMQRQTRMGRAMRAVAYDAELAKACGIDANKVILGAFSISSALAATAGILVALDVDMVPTMGLRPLMLGIVAMVAGGVDSIAGIALASAVLGMALHLSAWTITSEWQDAIAFAILLAFLLVRPQGFLGREIPKATV